MVNKRQPVDLSGNFKTWGDYVKNNIYSLPVSFSVENEVSNEDDRFIEVSIDVLHLGLNKNKSIFTKDVVDENIDTIANTPILGFVRLLSDGEKDFKGHESVLTRTINGIEYQYIGSAYGVIPQDCNPHWVKKFCDDGVEREFLRVRGLVWTKFSDASNILTRDIEKPHSMELYPNNIEGHEDEDGNFVFDKFSFFGCCILGDDIEPAMENSNVVVQNVNYSVKDFVANIQDELNNKFAAFTKLLDKKNVQGGVGNMPNSDFAQTVMQQFEDIAQMVRAHETFTDSWGYECSRFYAVDIQDSEVIVVDCKDNYHYYGVPFTMDGDKPVMDFACAKRKKVTYSDYEEGTVAPEGAFDFGMHISEIEKVFSDKADEADGKIAEAESAKEKLEADFEAIKSELEEIKPKYDELFAADEQRKANELNAEKDAKLDEYEESLGGTEAFEAIKAKKGELSVDDIEKECAVLYVKADRAKSNFSKSDSGDAVVDIIDDVDDTLDGYVNTKYGYIKVNR